jgi:hypothetical protein
MTKTTKSLLDRRTFLKDASALTVSAALAASAASTASSAAAAQGPRIAAVLFDSRYSSCRSFVNAFALRGAAAFDVRGDIAALWYSALRDHLAKHGGPVAGLTAHSDLVVSQAFGRELRLALRYEGAHDSRGSQAIAHRLRGRINLDEITAALQHADSDWSESLADAIARTRWVRFDPQWQSSLAQTSAPADHPGFLSSWLLASSEKI